MLTVVGELDDSFCTMFNDTVWTEKIHPSEMMGCLWRLRRDGLLRRRSWCFKRCNQDVYLEKLKKTRKIQPAIRSKLWPGFPRICPEVAATVVPSCFRSIPIQLLFCSPCCAKWNSDTFLGTKFRRNAVLFSIRGLSIHLLQFVFQSNWFRCRESGFKDLAFLLFQLCCFRSLFLSRSVHAIISVSETNIKVVYS